MNNQFTSPLSKAIRKALKPTVSTFALSAAMLTASSVYAYHGEQETAFIFYNDNLLLAPTTLAPAIPAISTFDQPLTTSSCVDLGYVAPGSTITKKFTIASSETGATSGTVTGDFTYDSLSSITFTGGTEFQQSGSAQNATNLTSGIVISPLCNSLGATTGGTTADPLKTGICAGIASSTSTAPTGAVGYFDIKFTAPTTPQIITGRYMNVYTSTDPVVNPLSVQITASVVSSLTPKIQVLDSSLSVPPAGTDIPNGTTTAINFTPTAIDNTRPPVSKNFSVRNLGGAGLLLSPTTATCVSDVGAAVAEFAVTPFIDDIGTDTSTPASTTSVDTTVVPDYAPGCPAGVKDYSKFTVSFTPPLVTKQTKYTCKVTFTSNDGGITGTKFTFPVEATVNPPPPLKPEIDVYDGTKLIPNLNQAGIDFGTTTVGQPVQRTLTVKNPSGTNLSVFDFSSNLPTGFSLLNANYASTIPPGGSTNLIFQCDATAGGSFGASQDSCISNPLGAGCALRIPSNDDDNPVWEFNGGGVENPYTIPFRCVVSGGTSTNVSLNLTQPANGVVTSDTGGISCGTGSTGCTASYSPGASVSLTATADTGATFSGWGGDCTGTTSPLLLTMDTSKNCTATFTSGGSTGNQVALTITTPSNGVVTSDKGGINCGTGGSTCTSSYDPSTIVVLTATPDSGATFTQWGGSCAGTTSPLSVTMDTAKNCTATFTSGSVTTDVTLTITKPTVGNIMSSAGGVNCGTAGTTCSATYPKDTTIQLMGAADNMTLDTWTGDCSGSNNPLSVAMSQDKTCSATFKTGGGTTTQPTLTISPQPTGGSVTGNPGGISCGASGSTCVANYTAGDVVSLAAIPATGNNFTGWGGSCTGTTNPLSVTMDAAKTCSATFTAAGGNEPPPPTSQLLTINTPTGGKVTSNVGGISCGTNSINCTANFTTGSIVQLTAMPDAGATFTGWGGNCTGTTSPTALTMDAAKTCSATFTTTGGSTCSSTNLPACTTEAACIGAGGTFVGGVCTTSSTGSCSATHLSACTTEASCGDAGGVFSNNTCTVAPILTHPDKGTAAAISNTAVQSFNVPTLFSAGVSVNGGPFMTAANVKASDVAEWAVNLTVNPAHVGQTAQLLFVIGVEPPATETVAGYTGGVNTVYHAFDAGLNLFPVNLYASAAEWPAELAKMTTSPFKANINLKSKMSFSLRKGTLATLVGGKPRARVYTFVGYALADGTIVYNGMPIMTTLE